jgi:hypothetical protein
VSEIFSIEKLRELFGYEYEAGKAGGETSTLPKSVATNQVAQGNLRVGVDRGKGTYFVGGR